ncbi:hypothetical protein BT96DRAFT_922493 [Gymnopus androsaceus JB14]|uniref:Uncharacterized protein n=1 Tax=Gymnopus androsaceus JB14 TaxID=1447944 RepID=A0A6A4HDQ6_9AGAR|nr:hypothetical protein BT96DRAFT_922493 [Gymnopus androsaceus JB14]
MPPKSDEEQSASISYPFTSTTLSSIFSSAELESVTATTFALTEKDSLSSCSSPSQSFASGEFGLFLLFHPILATHRSSERFRRFSFPCSFRCAKEA